jgi:glycerate 2-kinase
LTIIRTKAQEAAYRVVQETLQRVRADVLLRNSCWREQDRLFIGGESYDLKGFERVLVLGAGKASAAMAQGLASTLGGFPIEGLVVTKYGHSLPAEPIRIMEAAHPVPDENSLIAGRRLLHLASSATEKDLVVVLISGGASALMESPAEGVTLREIQVITQGLLRSGADIHELNTVRTCLSDIKGGGLARACGNAQIVCILLSDIEGNPRDLIGSGPCWGGPASPSDAMAVLRGREIEVSPGIIAAIERSSHRPEMHPPHVVVGDIFTLLEEAQRAAVNLGLRAKVYGRTFSGEAREVGARMAAEALALSGESEMYDCVIAAGETVVTVTGSGSGGRNQELACAAAIALEDVADIGLIAIGTDGTDGPTDAAGGLVDGDTAKRADLGAALDSNDCYDALQTAGGLIVTGPTQTNLNDLVVITRLS